MFKMTLQSQADDENFNWSTLPVDKPSGFQTIQPWFFLIIVELYILIIVYMSSASKKNEKYDFMAKVIIIGDSGIGKTVLITRYC